MAFFPEVAYHAALRESSDVHLVFERLPRYEERHWTKTDCVLNNFTTTNRDKKWPSIYISKNYSFPLCTWNVVSWMSGRNVIPKYLILLDFQLEKIKLEGKEYPRWQVFEIWMHDSSYQEQWILLNKLIKLLYIKFSEWPLPFLLVGSLKIGVASSPLKVKGQFQYAELSSFVF